MGINLLRDDDGKIKFFKQNFDLFSDELADEKDQVGVWKGRYSNIMVSLPLTREASKMIASDPASLKIVESRMEQTAERTEGFRAP